MTTPCNFQLCTDISCSTYCATGVFYVSLSTFRNIFKFQTTDIVNNELSETALTTSQNITYFINSSLLPEINPAHAMMDASGSEGIIFTNNSPTANLIKHDYIYYLSKEITGSVYSVGLFNNITNIKDEIEALGWDQKNNMENKFIFADNNGNGMVNTNINPATKNLSKRIMEQIKYHNPDRFQTSTTPQNNRIRKVTTPQSIPLIEGDSISYYWTLKQTNIADRKYRIKLYLTDDNSKTNTQPTDSKANTPEYSNITSDGVP